MPHIAIVCTAADEHLQRAIALIATRHDVSLIAPQSSSVPDYDYAAFAGVDAIVVDRCPDNVALVRQLAATGAALVTICDTVDNAVACRQAGALWHVGSGRDLAETLASGQCSIEHAIAVRDWLRDHPGLGIGHYLGIYPMHTQS